MASAVVQLRDGRGPIVPLQNMPTAHQPLLAGKSVATFPLVNPPTVRPKTSHQSRTSSRLSFRDLASPLPARVKLKWAGSSDLPATDQVNATWFRPADSFFLNELERRGAHSTLGFYRDIEDPEYSQPDRPRTPPGRIVEEDMTRQMHHNLSPALRKNLAVVKLPTMDVDTNNSPLAGVSRIPGPPKSPLAPEATMHARLPMTALPKPQSPTADSPAGEERAGEDAGAEMREAVFADEWGRIVELQGEDFRVLALKHAEAEQPGSSGGWRRRSLLGDGEMLAVKASLRRRVPHWPQRHEEAFWRGKLRLQTFELDALSFTSEDLCHLGLEMFLELGIPQELNLPLEPFRRLVLAVRARMLDNPYHNWWHAFDVTQTMYALLVRTEVLRELSVVQRLAVMVAALCHDLEHPGVNNAFVTKANTMLAKAYHGPSKLELHHTYRALTIVDRPDINLLSALPPADANEVRRLVRVLILATDMARHADFVRLLKRHGERVGAGEKVEMGLEARLEILIKIADTSNVLKPFFVGKKWLMRVTEEFFQQGDKERRHGMEVTPSYDRNQQPRVELQKGFIDFLMLPFYELVIKLFPQLGDVTSKVRSNRQWWDRYDDTRLLNEARASGFAPPRLGSRDVTDQHQHAPWTSETWFGDMQESTLGLYKKQRARAEQIGRLGSGAEQKSKWNVVRGNLTKVAALRPVPKTPSVLSLEPDPLLPHSEQLVRKTRNVFKSAMQLHQHAQERFKRHATAWNF